MSSGKTMRNEPINPTERTRINAIFASQSILESASEADSFNPVAMTIENLRKNDGFSVMVVSGF